MNVNSILSIGIAIASLNLLTQATLAQTSEPVQSCRNYVGNSIPAFRNIPLSEIEVSPQDTTAGVTTVNWRITSGVASGTCTVAADGKISDFRQNPPAEPINAETHPALEQQWGEDITPYRGQIEPGSVQRLQSRPGRRNQTTGEISPEELVTVYRRHMDGNTAWVMVRGQLGQAGWINESRLLLLSEDIGNYGSSSAVEYSWGEEIPPYRTQITNGISFELLHRPIRGEGLPVAPIRGNEGVIVYRTHQDRGLTWALVKGEFGQEGWVNTRRLIRPQR